MIHPQHVHLDAAVDKGIQGLEIKDQLPVFSFTHVKENRNLYTSLISCKRLRKANRPGQGTVNAWSGIQKTVHFLQTAFSLNINVWIMMHMHVRLFGLGKHHPTVVCKHALHENRN